MRHSSAFVVAVLLAACASPSASQPNLGSEAASASPAASTFVPGAPLPTPLVTPIISGPGRLKLAVVASGLNSPIGMVNAGDGSGRLFVNERGGLIRVVETSGTLRAAPFVDLSGRIDAGGEQGLLGVAFHPDFAANRRLFVHYSRRGDGATVVSELAASADRSSADPASERILLVVAQPYGNHNGGQIAFGPDGYLYIGLGDGGSGGDPQGNGQNRQVLLGKMLRIDVDAAHAAGKQYGIPPSNPYASGGVSPGAGLPEIWAYGLRNPWRFSFDRMNGDLYIGDVGQGSWEEIDRQPASSQGGENYGWNAHEGNHCYSSACGGVTANGPIAEYGHNRGCAVTGGYVYRGTAQPPLAGIYLFGDYCAGTIFSVPAGGATQDPKLVTETGRQISSFGEGEDGEIYVVDLGGGLYRVLLDS
jgi:glucose/arabinose dehydrogenase